MPPPHHDSGWITQFEQFADQEMKKEKSLDSR